MRHVGKPIPSELECEYEYVLDQLNDWNDTEIIASFYHDDFDNCVVIRECGELRRVTWYVNEYGEVEAIESRRIAGSTFAETFLRMSKPRNYRELV